MFFYVNCYEFCVSANPAIWSNAIGYMQLYSMSFDRCKCKIIEISVGPRSFVAVKSINSSRSLHWDMVKIHKINVRLNNVSSLLSFIFDRWEQALVYRRDLHRPWARGVHHAPPPPPTSLQNYVFLNPQSVHNKKWDVNSKNIGTHYWFTALF